MICGFQLPVRGAVMVWLPLVVIVILPVDK